MPTTSLNLFCSGQFHPFWGGQFPPFSNGLFQAFLGGQVDRVFHHIIEFNIRERKTYGDTKLYLGIIQSQLSDNELALLFYNCLSKYAKKKDTLEPRFYNIMDSYGILENVDSDSLLSRNHHVLYPQTNFKFLNADEKDIKKTMN